MVLELVDVLFLTPLVHDKLLQLLGVGCKHLSFIPTMTRRTATARPSLSNEPSLSSLATSTPIPLFAIARAIMGVSIMNGSITNGSPKAKLSMVEPHPQCVRNAPVAPCASAFTCGTHPVQTSPRSRVRSSNPAGNRSCSSSFPVPVPAGFRRAQRKRTPASSSPSASSWMFCSVSGASLPSAT
uniref:Uncharacterized protein n=1 Tax=Triticum urartu TaxID=4572 RepID=A0A8R7QZB8_TRIUA